MQTLEFGLSIYAVKRTIQTDREGRAYYMCQAFLYI